MRYYLQSDTVIRGFIETHQGGCSLQQDSQAWPMLIDIIMRQPPHL